MKMSEAYLKRETFTQIVIVLANYIRLVHSVHSLRC